MSEDPSEVVSEAVWEAVYGREWTWKASGCKKNATPVTPISTWTPISLLGLSVLTTVAALPVQIQLASYMTFVAATIFFDFVGIFGRMLAPQSKKLIPIAIVLCALAVMWPSATIIAAAAIVSSMIAFVVFRLNADWLMTDLYLMAPSIQHILIHDEDNQVFTAWQDYLKRQCRTMALELGFPYDDKVLELLYKPLCMTGYLLGYRRSQKLINRAESAEAKVTKLEEKINRLEKELGDKRDQLKLAKDELREVAQKLADEEYQCGRVHKLYVASQKENEQLRQANSELIASLSDADQIAEAKTDQEESVTDRARELLKAGYSIRQVMSLTGLKKHVVEKIRKQLMAETDGDDDDSDVIVQLEASGK